MLLATAAGHMTFFLLQLVCTLSEDSCTLAKIQTKWKGKERKNEMLIHLLIRPSGEERDAYSHTSGIFEHPL